MNNGIYEVKKTKMTATDITQHAETVKSINTELHRIYGLINGMDIGFASKKEIQGIENELVKIRKRLELYCGGFGSE